MSEEEGEGLWMAKDLRGPMTGIVFRHLEMMAFALKDPGMMSVVLFDRPFPCFSDTMVVQGVVVQAETN